MNLKRGLDRIAIVLAVICMVPAFLIGAEKYSKYKKIEIKVTPGRMFNDKELNITNQMLKDWHIEFPHSDWAAYPTIMRIEEGAIAYKRNTGTYWQLYEGEWYRLPSVKDEGVPDKLQPKSHRKKFAEGLISGSGKYIVKGGKWVKYEEAVIEIGDETTFSNYKVVSITFYPPHKNYLIAGLLTAIVILIIVLFSLMGLVRLIGWIIAGFKHDVSRV